MKAEEIQLSQEYVLVKLDKIKTFKDIQVEPVIPKGQMNVVKDGPQDDLPEYEVEEVERTIAYIIQKGTIIAIGPGETVYNVGDKVFIRLNTGMDFQRIGSVKGGTNPKLIKKYEIIGKVI